ncbi:FtsX-like permease family protein [Clostridium sp.]|uniref:FtsX-like permease family protein n=1 Tax=Clostridium sp. TaxID=1506 RepID=UPI00346424A0
MITMFLISIALKNVKNNLYENTLYFVSLIFGVISYYTFSSLSYFNSEAILVDYTDTINLSFRTASVFIRFFLIIFIWYCNLFFINKRKKELGIYSVLGLKKRQISLLLFFEILFMGLFSISVGIVLGRLFFRLFLMMVLALCGISLSLNPLIIVPEAIKSTINVFFSIFLIISIISYLKIKRSSIISLINSYSLKKRDSKISIILSLFFMLLLILGYYIFFKALFSTSKLITLGGAIILFSTYGLFSNILLLFIKISSKFKRFYYKDLNMISLSDLLFKLKQNSKTFASISLLIASLIFMVTFVFIQYNYDVTDFRTTSPFDFTYLSESESLDKGVDEILSKYKDHGVTKDLKIPFFSTRGIYPSLGTSFFFISDYEGVIPNVNVIPEESFEKLNSTLGINDYSDLNLALGESIMVYGRELNEDYVKPSIDDVQLINLSEKFKVKKAIKNKFLDKFSLYSFIVINNEDFNRLYPHENLRYLRCLSYENFETSNKLGKELYYYINKNSSEAQSDYITDSYTYYADKTKYTGIYVFIVVFTVFVLLICSGSIIFFSQLTQAEDEVDKYKLLNSLGVSKKEIILSIKRQIRLLFVLPFVVGVAHATCAILILKYIYEINLNFLYYIVIIFALIYYVYYVYTVKAYYKIITRR